MSVTLLFRVRFVVDIHRDCVRGVPQQALYHLGVVVVLPEQGRVRMAKCVPAIPKMSQETLAEMIGTTRSRVSFFMNRFRKLGFLNYGEGGMQVHSSLLDVVVRDKN